ncbi:right-handed parallel beta-helix repeat-containing protein [Puniceicoccus vermicola]|uniref:Right-handed parallel beta-helix repeat-containing protein n=1 Tax=Puniceicoccus vermicola TaxID=388746 RepID=A0A7X1AZG1_9BACT|nr:right-handed parallel beta-helix repeat-containing protein [Puniceicoccus vermicola]MBC2601710.1 right-handed parallel beta-helix repeat-containing protein [Puniceicoccus vermicola]
MKIERCIGGVFAVIGLSQFVAALTIEVEPSFESAGIYLRNAETLEYRVKYRESGVETWEIAPELVWTENLPVPRNSLLGLREGSEYEVAVWLGEDRLARETFSTLSSEVPVAKTVSLAKGPVHIVESGSPDGWIRYVSNGEIEGGSESPNAVTLNDVEYVILEGLTIKGGRYNAVSIADSRHVRIRNCDISGWGRVGERRYDLRGQFLDEDGNLINRDAGILIERCYSVVVEYCYIHDPRGTSNSWAFSHPTGPSAIYVIENENTVIRYNDMIGSNRHRWNDVIESARNGSPEGGFRKDADIYGNAMLFGNDDGVELDGGQMNMRVWGNLIEGTFAGISTAPSFHGPSYLFNNLIVNSGDRLGLFGDALKTNYRSVEDGSVYFLNNTIYRSGRLGGFPASRSLAASYVVQNNVLFPKGAIIAFNAAYGDLRLDRNLFWSSDSEYLENYRGWLIAEGLEEEGVAGVPLFEDSMGGDFTLANESPGAAIAAPFPGFPDFGLRPGISGEMPLRESGVELSRRRIQLQDEAPVEVKISLADTEPLEFQILKNEAFSWFDVETSANVVGPGNPVTLRISRVADEKIEERSGAFLVKLKDGLSVPVIVENSEKPLSASFEKEGDDVVAFIDAESMSGVEKFEVVEREGALSGKTVLFSEADDFSAVPDKVLTATFNCPEDGIYFLAVRLFAKVPAGSHNSVFFAINDDPLVETQFRCAPGWNWAGVSRVQELRNKAWFEPIFLEAGEVTLRIAAREKTVLDAILVLKSPEVIFSSSQ